MDVIAIGVQERLIAVCTQYYISVSIASFRVLSVSPCNNPNSSEVREVQNLHPITIQSQREEVWKVPDKSTTGAGNKR